MATLREGHTKLSWHTVSYPSYPYLLSPVNAAVYRLAWAEIYLVTAALVHHFDFKFQGASPSDFECDSDQFSIGTRGKGVLNDFVGFSQK